MITGEQIRSLRNSKGNKRTITGNDITNYRKRVQHDQEQQSADRKAYDTLMSDMALGKMYKQMPYSGATGPESNYSVIRNKPDYADKSKSAGEKTGFLKSILTGKSSTNTIEDLRDEAERYSYNQKYQPWENNKFNFDADKLMAINSMSADDEGVYNYIFNTDGKKAADKYLDDFVKNYTSAAAQKSDEKNTEYAKKHPILASADSILNNFEKPVGLLYTLAQNMRGEEVDPNSTAFNASRKQEAIRSGVKDNYDMGNVGGFLYDIGMSTGDALSASVFGPGTGALLIGSGAGADTAKQVIEKGGSDVQALLSGLASGAAETIFERISLGNLKSLKEVPIKSIKDIAKNTVKSTLVNASEEAATEISNIITDSIINGDISDYNIAVQNYISQGYSEAKAKSMANKDMAGRIGLAALGGALQGGAMSSVGQSINYASGFYKGSQVNKQGLTDNYIAAGKAEQDTDLYNLALEIEQKKQEGKKPTNYQIGTLARSVDTKKPQLSRNVPVNSQNMQTSSVAASIENNIPKTETDLERQNTKPINIKDATAKMGDIEGVKVKGIANVENGNATLNVDTGLGTATSSMDNIVFEDPAVQQVYIAASDYKTNGAKAFTENYDSSLSLPVYQKAFNTYYDAGVVDLPIETVNSAYGSLIPETVRMNAYGAGVNDAKITTANQTKNAIKNDGGVINNVTSEKMDADTKTVLDAMGKAFGVNIQIEESIAGGQANGLYKDGTIYIALDSDNPYMAVAKHELTHGIQQFSSDKYKTYKDFVIREINKSNPKAYDEMVDRLISRYGEAGQTITRDEAMDEIVADASEMFLTDPESIKNLASHDKTLAEKVIDVIRDIIDKIKKAMTNVEPKSRAAKALNENLETAKEAERLWMDALAEMKADNDFIVADETGIENVKFSLREKEPPINTIIGYKVFYAKDGKLYPPMVANPNGSDTPIGVWLDADVGVQAPPSKTGRQQVKAGGKGTQGGSGSLAFRPGWHLGEIPIAKQFSRLNPETGEKDLFPANFVWAECEIAADRDYQEEAMSYGYNKNGKFQHSLAGLPKLPVDGYYKYRTNPDPSTVPWYITGAMKVSRLLNDDETNAILKEHGIAPVERQGGRVDLAKLGFKDTEFSSNTKYSLKDSDGRELTEAQLKYFKDSKILDTEGNLKVVYHSGDAEYIAGDKTKISGYYFTGERTSETDIETYLNSKNPLVVNVSDYKSDIAMQYYIRNTLRTQRGYDGVIINDGDKAQYIVFRPGQIKKTTNTEPELTGRRYQLKEASELDYNSLAEENAKLKEAAALLENQFKLTKEYKPKKEELQKVARKILKRYNSKYDLDTMVENLTSLWNYIQNNEQIDGEEVSAATSGMAKKIIEKSSVLDDHLKQQYSDLINKVKTTSISISDRDKSDLMSVGGYERFRKQNFGRIRLTNDGLSVDSFYQELNELYPNMFPEEYTHPAERLMVIADVLDGLKPNYVNPFGMDMDEAAVALSHEIFDAYFDIPRLAPTFADKKKAELEKATAMYKQKIHEVKVEFRNERAKNKRLEKRIQHMRDARVKNENIKSWKTGIRKTTKELSDMLLRPAEKHYIPPAFRSAIIEVLQMIDLQTGITTPDGSPTKASEALDKLQRQYAKLAKDAEENPTSISSFYDEDVDNDLLALAEMVQGKRIIDLSYEQLNRVHDILKHLKQMIVQENKLFSDNLKDTVSRLGEQSIQDQANLKEFKRLSVMEKNGLLKYFGDMMNKGLLKPYYFFKQIGGTINTLYQNVRNGEDKYIEIINTGKKYVQDIMRAYDYNSWGGDKDKATKFTAESGNTLDLTIGQKLYIYLAYKRDQGKSHILQGGIVTDTPEITTGEQNGKKIIKSIKYKSQPVSFTENDIKKLTDGLTKDQIDFADKMGEFLSTYCAKLGNEVSLKLVGFEKFNEKNYIPLTSDSNFLYTKAGVMDDVRIKRSGFTKALTPKASNPIVAADLMEVWTKHVNDMAMYNSFVLPLEDFTRVWNYKRKGDKKYGAEAFSVKASIQRVYGTRANDYIKKMLQDINGGVRADNSAGLTNKLISLMKRGSVMANLSVAIQQPSSIARAFAVIDPKYFAKTVFTKRDYQELYKYSPQAVLKKYGYFDTNMGRTIQEIMVEQEYDTPLEKFKAFFRDKNIRDDVFSWLPQKMDELTWCHIWNAVKAETIDKTELQPDSKEFYEHVNNRFKEVIDRTQVMDSVFQRSEMMRSKDAAVKMATAFMSEPTVSFNMLHDALMEYKKNGKNAKPYINKALGTVLGAMVFNSLLKSIIGAMRDDDEDKTFKEKYLENVISNLADDPLSMIPYLNSAASIFEGYSVTRPDMQLVQNLYYSWSKWDSDKYTLLQKINDTSQSLIAFTGIPLKNVTRDIETLWRNGADLLENVGLLEGKTDYEKLKIKYPTIESSAASSKYYDMLYQAQSDKNTELYKQIYDDLIKNGKKPSNIEGAMRNRTLDKLKEHQELINAVVAKEEKNSSGYTAAKKKLLQEGYSVDDINSAVNSLYNERMKANAPTADEFIKAYKSGNKAVWKPLYDKMRAAGWSQEDIVKLTK